MIHRRIDIYALRCICGLMHALAFETLADPTRLRIVEVLLGGERPVNDIVAEVAIHQSGVSRHLRILTDAGFVQVRPKGQQRLYSLRAEPFREAEWRRCSILSAGRPGLDCRIPETVFETTGGRRNDDQPT